MKTRGHAGTGRRQESRPAHIRLTTRLITDTTGLMKLRSSWEGVQIASGDTNPFTQWTWVWHWWRLFGNPNSALKHRLNVLAVDDGTTVRAIFPFVLTTMGRGPIALKKLHLYGFTGSFTEMRSPLVWPGWEEAAMRALVQALYEHRRLYHWCLIEGLPEGEPLGVCFQEKARGTGWTWNRPETDYLLCLPGTWEEFRAGLKRNIKQSLRHCYNSLACDNHEWAFEVVTNRQELPEAIDEFLRLHALRASMPDTIPHQDHFPTPRRRLFLKRLARDLSAERRFMVCRLRVNGDVVASRIVLATQGMFYLYYSGYDPAWKRYSVMTTLTAECLKLAISLGYRTANLSPGTDVSKTRWGPYTRVYNSVRIPSPTATGRALSALRYAAL